MKICKKCGAIQDDNRFTCIDCENMLGTSLTKEEEDKVNKKISKTINRLSNKSDYFYVSKLDKVVIALYLIGAVINTVLMIINWSFFVGEEMITIVLLLTILMIIGSIELANPKFSWKLYQLKYCLTTINYDELIPSEIALFLRRAFSYFILLCTYAFLVYSLLVAIK